MDNQCTMNEEGGSYMMICMFVFVVYVYISLGACSQNIEWITVSVNARWFD